MKILLHLAGNIVPAPPLTLGGIELRITRRHPQYQPNAGGRGEAGKAQSLSCGTVGWSLVIQRTWNKKSNLGFWLKISQHRSNPGPRPLDIHLFVCLFVFLKF